MNKYRKIYEYIRCIPRTIFFNFYYLSFKQAVKFPIFVSHRTKFMSLGGKITVPKDAKTGKIKLGFGKVQISDYTNSNLIWNLSKSGIVHFGNSNKIGTGCKIHVSGILELGNKVFFSGESCIISSLKITIGDNCLISWNTLFMDTDFHPIIDKNNTILNKEKPIIIGNSVWIGARSTLLKGVSIGNNCIVSANSHVIKSYENDTIIGGNPSIIIGSMKGKKFTD